jgi:hypothetical protein
VTLTESGLGELARFGSGVNAWKRAALTCLGVP